MYTHNTLVLPIWNTKEENLFLVMLEEYHVEGRVSARSIFHYIFIFRFEFYQFHYRYAISALQAYHVFLLLVNIFEEIFLYISRGRAIIRLRVLNFANNEGWFLILGQFWVHLWLIMSRDLSILFTWLQKIFSKLIMGFFSQVNVFFSAENSS